MPDLGWVFFLNFSVCAGDTKDEALTKWNKMIREDEARYHWYQAAAEAVELALGPQPVLDDLDARMPKAVAERAVIKAARTLRHVGYLDKAATELPKEEIALIVAVDALQEVEGGL